MTRFERGRDHLEASDTIQLPPAATRRVGDDLLVSTGADRPVRRLGASGAALWEAFATGASIREVVAEIAAATGAPPHTVEAQVLGFVQELFEMGLARIRDG